jgi:pyochelin synthetase
LAADITVVRAEHSTVSEFADHPHAPAPDWGWAALTSGTVDTTTVPGTHHTLLAGQHLARVARGFRPASDR